MLLSIKWGLFRKKKSSYLFSSEWKFIKKKESLQDGMKVVIQNSAFKGFQEFLFSYYQE